MSLHLEKKQVLLIVSSFLICALLVVILYFKLYVPTVQTLELKKSELNNSQKGLELLQTKLNQIGDKTFDSTISLQKKVPVKALTDQLLLQFEKAETISKTEMKQITFMDSDAVALNEETNKNTVNIDDTNTKQPETTKTISLPSGVKSTVVNVSVEANNYFDLEEFIKQLQTMSRIISIDKIEFSGPTEMTSLDQDYENLTFQVTASAFYMPELKALADQLPKMDVPLPSEKLNPFVSFPDVEQDDSTSTP